MTMLSNRVKEGERGVSPKSGSGGHRRFELFGPVLSYFDPIFFIFSSRSPMHCVSAQRDNPASRVDATRLRQGFRRHFVMARQAGVASKSALQGAGCTKVPIVPLIPAQVSGLGRQIFTLFPLISAYFRITGKNPLI